jgi:hypothetical protein
MYEEIQKKIDSPASNSLAAREHPFSDFQNQDLKEGKGTSESEATDKNPDSDSDSDAASPLNFQPDGQTGSYFLLIDAQC